MPVSCEISTWVAPPGLKNSPYAPPASSSTVAPAASIGPVTPGARVTTYDFALPLAYSDHTIHTRPSGATRASGAEYPRVPAATSWLKMRPEPSW
jgi:hypothetical protein